MNLDAQILFAFLTDRMSDPVDEFPHIILKEQL